MSPEPTELPIACTLDAGELNRQEQRWAELIEHAGAGRVATPDGVQLRFRSDAEATLRDLVATERTCCAWATWEISDDGELLLRVRASADGVPVLRSMFLPDEA